MAYVRDQLLDAEKLAFWMVSNKWVQSGDEDVAVYSLYAFYSMYWREPCYVDFQHKSR